MQNLYKKLLQLSKRNLSIQEKLKNKQLLDQIKIIIDQKKQETKSNIHSGVDHIKTIIDQKKQETKTNIHSGVDHARLWMEEFTGLDKVQAAQSDALHYQNEYIRSQNKRRELGVKLTTLQMELNELHNDIVNTDKRDEKYIQLITREHKLFKMENQLRNDFVLTESEERENFTLFTTKIKESQDKEKEQALRTKYWTIAISSVITVIGVVGNGGISWFKMHGIVNTIMELGAEVKALNLKINATLADLDPNQAVVVGQVIARLSGAVKESVAAVNHEKTDELKELLRQTNAKLDDLSKAQTLRGHKINSDTLVSDASQANIVHTLKQISSDVEMLKRKTLGNVEMVRSESANEGNEVSRNDVLTAATDIVQENKDANVGKADSNAYSSPSSPSDIKHTNFVHIGSDGRMSRNKNEVLPEEDQSGGLYGKVSSLGSSTYNLAARLGAGTYNAVTGIASNPKVQSVGSSAYNSITNPKETITNLGSGTYNIAATVGSTTYNTVMGLATNPKETISSIGASTSDLGASIGSTTEGTISGIVQGYGSEETGSDSQVKSKENLDISSRTLAISNPTKTHVISKELATKTVLVNDDMPVSDETGQSSVTKNLFCFGLASCIVMALPFVIEQFLPPF